MARIHTLLLLLTAWLSLAAASSAPTFCKCTCFKNSTIIPLDLGGQPDSSGSDTSSSAELSSKLKRSTPFLSNLKPLLPVSHGQKKSSRRDESEDAPRIASGTCSDCTKAFCLSQGIDFCKDAEEDDVMTQCFQRDSNKDKIIVWGFIVGTLGLLGWAGVKRVLEWRESRNALGIGRGDPISYNSVPSGR